MTSAKAHVIVADISMPHVSGLDALSQLKRDNPAVRVVFLTMHSEGISASGPLGSSTRRIGTGNGAHGLRWRFRFEWSRPTMKSVQ